MFYNLEDRYHIDKSRHRGTQLVTLLLFDAGARDRHSNLEIFLINFGSLHV